MNLGYTPPVQNRGPGQCLQCSDSSVHARLSHRLPTRLSLCISLCETLVPSPPPSGSSGSPRGGQATASLTLRTPPCPNTTPASRRCSSHRLPWRALPAPLQVRGLQLACSPRSPIAPAGSALPPRGSVLSPGSGAPEAGLLQRSRAPSFLLEWITGSRSAAWGCSLRLLLHFTSSAEHSPWACPLSLQYFSVLLPGVVVGQRPPRRPWKAVTPSDCLIRRVLVARMCLGQSA